jgi:hypothetical protein
VINKQDNAAATTANKTLLYYYKLIELTYIIVFSHTTTHTGCVASCVAVFQNVLVEEKLFHGIPDTTHILFSSVGFGLYSVIIIYLA